MKSLFTAALLAASLVSTGAIAQSPGVGYYVGAGLGQSNYSDEGCVGECDKTDLGGKVYGGYMFTPYLGAEIGYGSFGKATVGFGGLGNVELQSSGFHGFLTAQYPVDNWSIFGKIGLAYLDNEIDANVLGVSMSESDSSTEFAWGLGVTYMFNRNLGLRGEYENYEYSFQDFSDNIRFWSVSLQYRF